MFILRDLSALLQAPFSDSKPGRERAHGFVFTLPLLAVIVSFTSSMTSNLLRSLQTLFGLNLNSRRFYAFMASPKLPWDRIWSILLLAYPFSRALSSPYNGLTLKLSFTTKSIKTSLTASCSALDK